MSRRWNDKALERALDGLERLHPDDSAAILDALDPAERARIDALGGGPKEPPAEEAEPVFIWEGLSPWLVERIAPEAPAGRGGRAFVLMTPAAAEALRTAAEPFRTQSTRRSGGATLLGRAFAALSGGRR